jgi:hypothetical protein
VPAAKRKTYSGAGGAGRRMRTKPIYTGIFLLALSILLFEIALTRVFAIMMWHHFTYMVVSIALLGFGAAGSILTARRAGLRNDDPSGALTKLAAGYGFAVMLATCCVTLVRIDSLVLWKEPSNFIALLLIYLVICVPFVLGGMAIGLVLTRFPTIVDRLYFADLAGSAAGGAASVLLLSSFGGMATVVLAGSIGVLAAAAFSLAAPLRHRIAISPLILAAGWLSIAFSGGSTTLHIPAASWRVPFAPGKEIGQSAEGMPEVTLSSATAQVEVTSDRVVPAMIGGNFGVLDQKDVHARYVGQDGTAPTMLYAGASKLELFPFLDDSQAGSAYVTLKARGGADPNVLVIGVGGGVDVMLALANGARTVTAVEINSAMIDMVTKTFADYCGGLFTPGAHPLADRVRLVHEEGRSYMRRQRERYDIIQMSGVDSFTALSTGAYTLSESYLYTKEAVREFYDHLAEGGYVNYSRFVLNRPKKPRETLRLANIARAALADLGIADPAAQICVFQGLDWASTIIKRGPFTAAEIAALDAFARREGFKGLLFDPLHPAGRPYLPSAQELVRARQFFVQAVEARAGAGDGVALDKDAAASRLLVAFEQAYAGSDAAAQSSIDAIVAALPEPARAELAPKLPGLVGSAVAGARAEQTNRDWAETRADFAAVLRGDQDERERFIAAWPYDLSACTDDRPFFFNYYKYSQLWQRESRASSVSLSQERYHPDFPVGHVVLLASLLQIVLIAIALIVMPLRSLARGGVPTPGKLRYLAYFAALGLGFMFVEIVLMQRLVIFLGHPTYALSVVLTSILGFAGLGSFLSGRFRDLGRGTLLALGASIVAVIMLEAYATQHLLPRLLAWTLGARVVATIALLAPLGIVLGMPFPCGIRILKSQCPQLLPWGWAVNGVFSVFASLFCIVLSMAIGFTQVFYVAAGIYALGFVLMKPKKEEAPEPAAVVVPPAAPGV